MGTGRTIWNILPENLVTVMKLYFVILELSLVATGAVKVTILLFYRRLTTDITTHRRPVFGAIALTIASTVVIFFATLFNCQPLEASRRSVDVVHLSTHDVQCNSGFAVAVSSGAFVIFSDLYSVALPCHIVWKLTILKMRDRIALGRLFSAGLLVSVAHAILLYYIVSKLTQPTLASSAVVILRLLRAELYSGGIDGITECNNGIVSARLDENFPAVLTTLRRSVQHWKSHWASSLPPCRPLAISGVVE